MSPPIIMGSALLYDVPRTRYELRGAGHPETRKEAGPAVQRTMRNCAFPFPRQGANRRRRFARSLQAQKEQLLNVASSGEARDPPWIGVRHKNTDGMSSNLTNAAVSAYASLGHCLEAQSQAELHPSLDLPFLYSSCMVLLLLEP
jgi:hypothetical protein